MILARRGVVDTSLRTLAAELGTTSRMLVHYFGTKDHLTEAVLAHVQRDLLSDDQPPSTVSALRDRLLREWKIMTDNESASSGRILGQIMGAACSQDSPYAEYVDQLLDQLVSNLADRLIGVGVSPRRREVPGHHHHRRYPGLDHQASERGRTHEGRRELSTTPRQLRARTHTVTHEANTRIVQRVHRRETPAATHALRSGQAGKPDRRDHLIHPRTS